MNLLNKESSMVRTVELSALVSNLCLCVCVCLYFREKFADVRNYCLRTGAHTELLPGHFCFSFFFCVFFPAPILFAVLARLWYSPFALVYQCSTVLALVSKIVSVFVFLFTWEDILSLSSLPVLYVSTLRLFSIIFRWSGSVCVILFRLILFFFRLASPPPVDHDQGALCRIGRRKVKKRKCVQ